MILSSSEDDHAISDKMVSFYNWIRSPRGCYLMDIQRGILSDYLSSLFGRYGAILSIAPNDNVWDFCKTNQLMHISPVQNQDVLNRTNCFLDVYNWPFQIESIDMVVLHHVLECVDFPHRLLKEACLSIRPGGKMVIIGFNPYSYWGIRRIFEGNSFIRKAKLFPCWRVEDWLMLLDFERCYFYSGSPFYPSPKLYEFSGFPFINKKTFISSLLGSFYILGVEKSAVAGIHSRFKWKLSKSSSLAPVFAGNTVAFNSFV